MQTIIQNIPTNYYTSTNFQTEKNTKTYLFLHGRGQDGLSFKNITDQLDKRGDQRISLDFPGFGKTEKPKEVWGVMEYTRFTQNFIDKKNLTDLILVGHSFGCRVALMLSRQLIVSTFDISHQYLFGPAGVEKTINPVRKIIGKIAKKAFSLPGLNTIGDKLKNKFGSLDYKMAGDMKDIFVKIVNEDLTHILHKVQVPTTIIRGDADDQILSWQVETLINNIPNCKLEIVQGADHFVHTQFDISDLMH